ncbi:unnamed protein product [Arctia plantaginis]|nr:unnamed protein product [Arctia plantaginis]
MWYGFITTGEPIPKKWSLPMTWPPTSVNRTPHMSFGEFVKLGDILLEKRARFWDNIYEKYYRQPEPPPLHDNATLKMAF